MKTEHEIYEPKAREKHPIDQQGTHYAVSY